MFNSLHAQTVAEFEIAESVLNVCTVSGVRVKLTDLTPNESYRLYITPTGRLTVQSKNGYPSIVEDPNWNGNPTLYMPFTATSTDQILEFTITPKIYSSNQVWPYKIGWLWVDNTINGYLTNEVDPSQELSLGFDDVGFFATEPLNAMPYLFGPFVSTSNMFDDFKLNNNTVINLNKFYINDKMIINETLELGPQSKIYFGPNGSLEIAEDEIFRAKGAFFQNACNESWGGIELMEDAQMALEGAVGQPNARCLINGARIGVNSQSSSKLFCYDTDFKNNYIGVNHDGELSTFEFDISNCKFFGLGTLPASVVPIPVLESGSVNFESIQPYAGVRLCNNTNYNALTGGNNQFYNMENGIILKNSSGDFSNCKFKDIKKKYMADNENAGNAIIARDPNPYGASSIYYKGQGSAQNKDIVDCDFGIITHNYGLDLSTTYMSGITATGAEASNGSLKLSSIRTNNITAGQRSVKVANNFLSSVDVLDNYLFVNSGSQGSSACVEMSNNNNISNLTNGSVRVANNHIHNYGQGVGIRSLSDQVPVLKDNVIIVNDKTYGDGIRIDNGFASYVSCNYLTQTSMFTPGLQASAIRTFMSPNSFIQCNNENSFPRGYTFLGTSTASSVRGNSVYQNETGLLYDLEAVTGKQPNIVDNSAILHGNTWNGYTFTDFGARHRSTDPFLINLSRYTNDDLIPGHSTSVITGNPLSAWFVDNSSFETFECEDEIPAFQCGELGPVTPITPRSDSADVHIADGGIESDLYPGSYRWLGERQLFKKLVVWPSLLPTKSVFQPFYDANANTSIGKLALMEHHISRVSMVPGLNPVTFRQQLFVIDSLEDAYRALMAQPNPTQQAIAQARSLIQSSRNTLIQQTASYNTLRQLRIQNLTGLNNSISASSVYETNEKMVNTIMLQYLQLGDVALDSLTMIALSDIANQCPIIGGIGVFNARSLVNMKLLVEWDDYELCEVNANRDLKEKNTTTQIESLLFPNPVDRFLNIRLERSEMAEVLIYDMRGVIHLRASISGGEQLDVANLQAGIYIAEVRMDGDKIQRATWIKQ